MDFKPVLRDWEGIIMTETVYSLFKNMVQNHRDEPAILENGRTMTFGALLLMCDKEVIEV